MNHYSDTQCQYCGSTMYKRRSTPHCSGDNMPEVTPIFNKIMELEFSDPSEFANKVDNLKYNECNYDMFIDFWTRRKENPSAEVKCLHEDTYFRDIQEEVGRLPIPDPYIPFPDLIEVYIAEIMLGRELTLLEKDGSRHIPKISDLGLIHFAPLTWVRFPHSYISLKDMTIKTDYTEPPLPKLFDINRIRGIYSGRDGDLVDE